MTKSWRLQSCCMLSLLREGRTDHECRPVPPCESKNLPRVSQAKGDLAKWKLWWMWGEIVLSWWSKPKDIPCHGLLSSGSRFEQYSPRDKAMSGLWGQDAGAIFVLQFPLDSPLFVFNILCVHTLSSGIYKVVFMDNNPGAIDATMNLL